MSHTRRADVYLPGSVAAGWGKREEGKDMGILRSLAGAILGTNANQETSAPRRVPDDGQVPAGASPMGAFDNASYNLAVGLKRSIVGPKGTIRGKFGISRRG
jgi:hypothetical protein